MNTCLRALLSLLLAGCLCTVMADIVNGGFETGGLNGWTTTGTAGVVTGGGFDPHTNYMLPLVGVGNYSAMIGDDIAWGYRGPESSSVGQTWTVAPGDPTDLYFAWAVVASAPSNGGHSEQDTPYFKIEVDWTHNGTTEVLDSKESYTGNVGFILPGWYEGAEDTTNSPGTFFYRPWEQYHLDLASRGITAGDELSVLLTVRDCTQSGHPAYAFLDGFGATPPPLPGVPEPASLVLFGTVVAGAGLLLRRRTT